MLAGAFYALCIQIMPEVKGHIYISVCSLFVPYKYERGFVIHLLAADAGILAHRSSSPNGSRFEHPTWPSVN